MIFLFVVSVVIVTLSPAAILNVSDLDVAAILVEPILMVLKNWAAESWSVAEIIGV